MLAALAGRIYEHAPQQNAFPLDSRNQRLLMSGYLEKYPKGSKVSVADRQELDEFRRTWRLHHPLTENQLAFASREATVAAVGFYHGGDVLYELTDIPGMWHEVLLRPAEHVAGTPRAI